MKSFHVAKMLFMVARSLLSSFCCHCCPL